MKKYIFTHILLLASILCLETSSLWGRGGRGGAFAAGAILGGFTGAAIASGGPYYYEPYYYNPYWDPYYPYGYYPRPYYWY